MAQQPHQSRPLRRADYYKLQSITEVALSPDGSRAVYTLRWQRQREDDAQTSLWIVATDGSSAPHRLTRGTGEESAPAFSPDGRRLAFLSKRPHEPEVAANLSKAETEREPKPQVWVLDLEHGGEPRQVTAREEGVEAFAWSPDGRRIAVAARAPTEGERAYLKSIKDKGPLVLRRTQHKHDAHGFLDEVRTHLFVIDSDSRGERQVTDGPCDETEPRWSPDGAWIAFLSNRTGDPDNNGRTDLWAASPKGDAFLRLTFGDVGARRPRWSPDGSQMAFVSSLEPENGYTLQHLMTVGVADAEKLAALPVGDWRGIVPDEVTGDPVAHGRVYPAPVRPTPKAILTEGLDLPVVGAPVWVDGDALQVPVGDRGQTVLLRCDGKGGRERVYPEPGDRLCTLGPTDAASGVTVAVVDRPETGGDLHRLGGARLTDVNGWMRERQLARYEWVQLPGSEALVARPDGAGPAPLLVAIHGGPMSYDSPGFRFDRQYWAGQGYVVLMVNYHGSISYGEAFCRSIQGDWGPREHADVMAGVDRLIELGWVDPQRLYCTGFSQGGIMTNWAVGHTDRFRAAVSEHGMWDYVAAYGTDDCHLWWQDDLGVPWQNEAAYRRISPSSGAAAIRTPLLITAGEHDWRCPLDQAELLYMTLKKRGVPTELVVYQDEHHAITKPKRAVDRLRRIARWLAAYGGQGLAAEDAET